MDTNKLTKQINTMLRPRAAMIAYSTDGGDTYFLEVRSIDNEGAMSEGRPVTVDFINELIKGYSKDTAARRMVAFQQICYGVIPARATRNTSGTTRHKSV